MSMSARIRFALLAIAAGGALALWAETPGAIQTTATITTNVTSSNQIWSALVLATNVADPKPAPPELKEFAPRMKRVFGYNQFELAGSASQEIGDQSENWLVPSKSFWMGLKGRRAVSKEAQGGYLLSLQLFQDKRPLVDTEVKLAPGSPLFIRGPQYGKGQLIIVLQVQR
jgi:hypothetical protein